MSWWLQLRASEGFFLVFAAVCGAMAGSFASAAIYRMPREDMTMIRPRRSQCPACRHTLSWLDNLPLLSWLWLRGKCRYCGVHYGAGYLLHEVVLCSAFLGVTQTWVVDDGPVATILVWIACTALWIATVIDWKYLILPDVITFGGIAFGILAALLVPRFHLWDPLSSDLPFGVSWFGLTAETSAPVIALVSSLVGAAISGGFLFGLAALFSYLLRQDALGLGDVKYLAAVGAMVGLEGATWTLLLGVIAAAAFGLLNVIRMICLVRSRQRRRGRSQGWSLAAYRGWRLGRVIPFGPFLVLGTVLILFVPLAVRQFFTEDWPRVLREILL